MTIGALGAYGFQPYVYNTNTVSAASMNKLSRISDDVLDKKIDYSELTDDSKNINPLKKGQTLDFQGMLEMQVRRGQNHAARIMKPMEEVQIAAEATRQDSEAAAAKVDDVSAQAAKMAEGVDAAGVSAGNGGVSYQMQQALYAYGMAMTA